MFYREKIERNNVDHPKPQFDSIKWLSLRGTKLHRMCMHDKYILSGHTVQLLRYQSLCVALWMSVAVFSSVSADTFHFIPYSVFSFPSSLVSGENFMASCLPVLWVKLFYTMQRCLMIFSSHDLLN